MSEASNTEFPQGYQAISEEDQRKAKAFSDKARVLAETGNYEYAIEMCLQGLMIDPDAVEAHQMLRDISMKRKASGGKPLGMFVAMQLRKGGKDEKANMLNAEKLLAYDPGNTDAMVLVLQNAFRAGYFDTVMWIGPILQRANEDDRKPDFHKFMTLRDIYKGLEQWKLATQACQHAAALRPDDMDLQTELKNLGALDTMKAGNYEAGDFRKSIRDMAGQQKLMEKDKDIQTLDSMQRAVLEAENEYKGDPAEPSKLMGLVDALAKTEQVESENRAIELLEQWYARTKQFRFRHRIGQIKLAQLNRMERSLRAEVEKNPQDETARETLRQFMVDKVEDELKEFQLWVENYPSETGFRFEFARRLFMLRRYDEAIPVLQQVRNDPKYRVDATTLLGRAFLGAEFVDEAVDTLADAIKNYQLQGDTKSIEMHYYYGNALEAKGDKEQALRMYSRVVQWNYGYKDVQDRIRRLRNKPQAPVIDLDEA